MTVARTGTPPRWLAATCGAVAAGALALPGWVVTHPPPIARPAVPRHPVRVVPPAELPPVEPMAFQDLAPADARAWNATVPFSTDPNPAARPFRLGGGAEDRARAIDCMAAAMLYEAGDDPVGERAVGQVVINRVRHPAFPKTICGVVFQGQERRTGCQFTFTCDGAIARAPNPAAWERAQKLAESALSGSVVAKVGHSTHYHTDWVVPYWSASLDKVAEVHTHLFFRWTGWWGTPPAFRRAVASAEPVIAKLAAWSPAHGLAVALDDAAIATAGAETILAGSADAAGWSSDGTFLATLNPALTPDQWPAWANTLCGPRDYCKVLAWSDRAATPRMLPAPEEQLATMIFSYLRDRAKGFDKPLWNCTRARRADPRQCMKTLPGPPNVPPPPSAATIRTTPAPRPTATGGATPPPDPEPLSGVRRAPRPSPTPRPSASDGAPLPS